jgi:hypothetical protein
MKILLISCWMLRPNCRVFRNALSVILPCILENLELSFATMEIFCLYLKSVISLSFRTSEPGRPFFCKTSTLLKNFWTPTSIFWAFSSNCNISPLLVRVILTSRIFSILSSIFRSSISSLFFKLINLMILFASVGISPSSPFILLIVYLLVNTSSCYSNMIFTMGHISFMDLEISIQMVSLASVSVFPTTICFCSCYSSFFNFSDVSLSVL